MNMQNFLESGSFQENHVSNQTVLKTTELENFLWCCIISVITSNFHSSLRCVALFLSLNDIVLVSFTIADVVVTKHHQRLDEIRNIFPRTSSKSCFQKIVSQFIRLRHLTQSSSHSTRLRTCYRYVCCTQHTLVRNGHVSDRKTAWLIPV